MHNQYSSKRTHSRSRFFKKGDLKLLMLELLAERPRHGYEMIQAIGDRFGGVHTPSAGSVYPALDLLADQGYVVGDEQEGKRIFSITPAGQTYLQEQSSAIADIRQRMDEWWAPATSSQLGQVHRELKAIHRDIAQRGGEAGEDALRLIRQIVTDAREAIGRVLEEAGSPASRNESDLEVRV